jgi:flagellar protein FliJ
MKKFKFRLDKILMIKEFYEIEAKLKYAEVLQKRIELENKNMEMEKSILSSMNELYKSKKSGDKIDFSELNFQNEYVNNLVNAIQINDRKKKEINVKLDVLKEDLIFATKEKKTFEELKKKDFGIYRDEVKKEDIKNLDDIAGQQYIRNRL